MNYEKFKQDKVEAEEKINTAIQAFMDKYPELIQIEIDFYLNHVPDEKKYVVMTQLKTRI